jgi:hypothetical protein
LRSVTTSYVLWDTANTGVSEGKGTAIAPTYACAAHGSNQTLLTPTSFLGTLSQCNSQVQAFCRISAVLQTAHDSVPGSGCGVSPVPMNSTRCCIAENRAHGKYHRRKRHRPLHPRVAKNESIASLTLGELRPYEVLHPIGSKNPGVRDQTYLTYVVFVAIVMCTLSLASSVTKLTAVVPSRVSARSDSPSVSMHSYRESYVLPQ